MDSDADVGNTRPPFSAAMLLPAHLPLCANSGVSNARYQRQQARSSHRRLQVDAFRARTRVVCVVNSDGVPENASAKLEAAAQRA